MNHLIAGVQFAIDSSNLLHDVQKERAATGVFLESPGEKYLAELVSHYDQTDASITNLNTQLSIVSDESSKEYQSLLVPTRNHFEQVGKHRDEVVDRTFTVSSGSGFYTELNSIVLNLIDVVTDGSHFDELARERTAYVNFLRAKEQIGLERALLTRAISKGSFGPGDYRQYSAVIAQQDSYLEIFQSAANPEQKALFEQTMNDPVVDEVKQIRRLAFKSGEFSTRELGVNANQWFDAMTKKIDLMHDVENRLAEDIIHLVQLTNPELLDLHDITISISRLVHELQKERGYTAGFLGSGGLNFGGELSNQRQQTTYMKLRLEGLLAATKSSSTDQELIDAISLVETKTVEVDQYRTRIDNRQIRDLDAIQFYTNLNALLMNVVLQISETTSDVKLKSQYFGYLSFMQAKEKAGLERAVLNRVFAADQLQNGALKWLGTLVGSQDSYFEAFRSAADAEQVAYFDQKMSNPIVDDVQRMRERVFERGAVNSEFQGMDLLQWHGTTEAMIHLLKNVEDSLSQHLQGRASQIKSEALTVLYTLSLSILLVVLGVMIAIYFISRSIREPIRELIEGAEIFGDSRSCFSILVCSVTSCAVPCVPTTLPWSS